MLRINDLRIKNKLKLARLNAPNGTKEKFKGLIFDRKLAHKHETIAITDCNLASKENRSVHALWAAAVGKIVNPDLDLYTMHFTNNFDEVVDWCIKENIRIINSSISTSYTKERDQAIKKYADWGGIWISSAGNDGYENKLSFPASSKYTISVGATNTGDNNSPELDIVADSYWTVPQTGRIDFCVYNGTSATGPVIFSAASYYLKNNLEGNLQSFRKWLLINSINDLDQLSVDINGDTLENGERFFVFPKNLIDRLLPLKIKLTKGESKMLLNGKEFDLRVAPFYKKYSSKYSALCTELRPIFEKAGFVVDFDDKTKTATLTR